MAAAEDLSSFLGAMTEEKIEEFVSPLRSGSKTVTPRPVSFFDRPYEVPVNPNENPKDRRIREILEAQYKNPAFFERICRAADIRTDSERRLDYSRTEAEAARSSAESAAHANNIARKANRNSLAAFLVALAAFIVSIITLLLRRNS